jgi:antitoxin component YwqK of YwqJK toxin-antitoxin module
MKRLLLLTAIFLTACGPSQKEKEEIAIITCNIMGESRNMDGVVRIKEINTAREQIGEDRFLGSDDDIKNSVKYGLCNELVLNDPQYSEKYLEVITGIVKVARIEKELAFLARAKNKERVKKLLAEGKKVTLHSNGQIEMIRMYKDGSLHGDVARFYKNGQLMFRAPYQNGGKDGVQENYDYDGNLTSKKCFKDGSEANIEKCKN